MTSVSRTFAVRHRPAFEDYRERYKYVRYVDEGDYEFLHDLQSDPDELINLAGNLKHRKTPENETTDRSASNLVVHSHQ